MPFLTPEEKTLVARILHEENLELSRLSNSSGSSSCQMGKSKRSRTDFESDSDMEVDREGTAVKWSDVLLTLKLPHIWLIGVIAGLFNGATLSGLT